MWNWIRNRAKSAVLAGLGDAVAELEQDHPEDLAPAIAQLRARIQPALPAPDRPVNPESALAHVNGVAPRGRAKRTAD